MAKTCYHNGENLCVGCKNGHTVETAPVGGQPWCKVCHVGDEERLSKACVKGAENKIIKKLMKQRDSALGALVKITYPWLSSDRRDAEHELIVKERIAKSATKHLKYEDAKKLARAIDDPDLS
jgi:hypothetical protein